MNSEQKQEIENTSVDPSVRRTDGEGIKIKVENEDEVHEAQNRCADSPPPGT